MIELWMGIYDFFIGLVIVVLYVGSFYYRSYIIAYNFSI